MDLEDIRILVPDGLQYAERVPDNTRRFADLMTRNDMRITFFTTGDVARRHPELVAELAAAGHEIGCHSDAHVPLDRQTPESFRTDLMRCLDSLEAAGVPRDQVPGFRAPMGSLIAETRWAYEVLHSAGFVYSSSVCPTPHGFYGWPEFGPDVPRKMEEIWEIPLSLTGLPMMNVPLGGIFFRVFPFALTRALVKRKMRNRGYFTTYIHPYDLDTEQERFMHPEIGESRLYNWLMYRNRHRVLDRFDSILRNDGRAETMRQWVERELINSN